MADEVQPPDGSQDPSQQISQSADLGAAVDAELASESGGGGSVDSSVATETAPTPERTLRSIAASRGYDHAPQYADDDQFFNDLISTAREFNSRRGDLEMADQVRGNWDQYQAFLRSQQQQQVAPAEPEKKSFWNPPPYDFNLEKQMYNDNGVIRFRDGSVVSPRILEQRAEAHRYVQEWTDRLRYNPQEAFAPIVDQATERAKKEIFAEMEKRQAAQQRRDVANSIISQHNPWLFTADDRMTPAGQAYHRHLEIADKSGISDPAAKDQYARSMMELEWARSQLQQSQQAAAANPVDQGEAAKQQFLASTRKPKNGTNGFTRTPEEPIGIGMLRSRLSAEFDAAGLTDNDFR